MQNNTAQCNPSIAKEDIYAGFFTRLAAYGLDALLLLCVLAIPNLLMWLLRLSSPDNFFTSPILFSFSPWKILKYLLSTFYFVFFTCTSGMTLGKKAMRIQVVAKDGRNITFFTALYRETIGKYLSTIFLCLGYLLIAIDKEKCGLHDLLCDTRVIYTCKVVEYKEQKTLYTPVNAFQPVPPQTLRQEPPQAFYPGSSQEPPQTFYSGPSQDGTAPGDTEKN